MRSYAKIQGMSAIIKHNWPVDTREVHCKARFIDPVKRRRDRDNAQASLKSAYDGLADARIVADDSGFVHWPTVFEVGPERKVILEIWTDEDRN